MNRRDFLKSTSLAAAAVALGSKPTRASLPTTRTSSGNAFKYRIAFGAWMNDMRCEPLPLEEWPAPQFDDQCVNSIIRCMDVQSESGYNMLDAWGYFATYGWPVDIVSA